MSGDKLAIILRRLTQRRRRRASERDVYEPYFDSSYYISTNKDIGKNIVDPFFHYVTFGWKENRDPCSWFSSSGYLALHPDVRDSGENPFFHYLTKGRHEKRAVVQPSGTSSDVTSVLPHAIFHSAIPKKRSGLRGLLEQKSRFFPKKQVKVHRSLKVIKAKGVRGVVEFRGCLDGRLAFVSGWAVSDSGLPMRISAPASGDVTECLGYEQVRRDVDTMRADVGFQAFLEGRFDFGRVTIELTEAYGDTPLRAKVDVDLPRLKADVLLRAVTSTIQGCRPLQEYVLPATFRYLAKLQASTEGSVRSSVLETINTLVLQRNCLKVLLISRGDPNASYLNLVMLASRLKRPADFIVVSLGETAQHFSSGQIANIEMAAEHSLHLVDGPGESASSAIIQHVLSLAAERGSGFLCILDDVSIATALPEIELALQEPGPDNHLPCVHAWLTRAAWPDHFRAMDGPPAAFEFQRIFPNTPRPVGVLAVNATAAKTLSLKPVLPYPGRGWALADLASSPLTTHIGRLATVDLATPPAEENSFCALLATLSVRGQQPAALQS
jgi:hypothetical protein